MATGSFQGEVNRGKSAGGSQQTTTEGVKTLKSILNAFCEFSRDAELPTTAVLFTLGLTENASQREQFVTHWSQFHTPLVIPAVPQQQATMGDNKQNKNSIQM